jgi:RNA methyltransferase, TrmH family
VVDGRAETQRPGRTARVRAAAAPTSAELALVRAAGRDPRFVRLEGVHALKHAVRFGAELTTVLTPDPAVLTELLARLCPDVEVPVPVRRVAPGTWQALTGRGLPSPALGVARRPAVTAADVLSAPGRVVVLEDPRHLGNLGAVVRVAAAASAAGVLVLGAADPWHPTAVRGAAGLQFALPVARAEALPARDVEPAVGVAGRPLVALALGGLPLAPGVVPPDAVLLVGTERAGLGPALLDRAERRITIPMRAGVASLNLATAVAIVLYTP